MLILHIQGGQHANCNILNYHYGLPKQIKLSDSSGTRSLKLRLFKFLQKLRKQHFQISWNIDITMRGYEHDNSDSANLQELRDEIHLSNSILMELAYNQDKYMDKLIKFNSQAKKLINTKRELQAEIYLEEAEKLLEYGASCGKTIERNVIICTLHNEACCFYREEQFTKTIDYLEAIIFNINKHIESLEIPQPIFKSKSKKNEASSIVTIQKKLQLVNYNINFITVNSRVKKRQLAIDTGLSTISLLNGIFEQLCVDSTSIQSYEGESPQIEVLEAKAYLKNLRLFKSNIDVPRTDIYVKVASHLIRKWARGKSTSRLHPSLQRHIFNYTLAQAIEMRPMDYYAEDINSTITTRCLMRHTAHLSMCFFFISAEYRLLAEETYESVELKEVSNQFTNSNIYHLLAICVLAANLNCDVITLKQFIASYEEKFKINLYKQEAYSSESIDKIIKRIGILDMEKTGSSINQNPLKKVKSVKSIKSSAIKLAASLSRGGAENFFPPSMKVRRQSKNANSRNQIIKSMHFNGEETPNGRSRKYEMVENKTDAYMMKPQKKVVNYLNCDNSERRRLEGQNAASGMNEYQFNLKIKKDQRKRMSISQSNMNLSKVSSSKKMIDEKEIAKKKLKNRLLSPANVLTQREINGRTRQIQPVYGTRS